MKITEINRMKEKILTKKWAAVYGEAYLFENACVTVTKNIISDVDYQLEIIIECRIILIE